MVNFKTSIRWVLRSILWIVVFFLLPVGCQLAAHIGGDKVAWWELRRDSSRQAPDATTTDDAIIQFYSARAARWRGAFGVHTWFATKKTGDSSYTRLEVIGYALRWTGHTVRVRTGPPDNYWFGSRPYLLREVRGGAEIDEMIDRLHLAAANYRYDGEYNVWPGPNSNTFTATLARSVPELAIELPSTAIGKDYLPGGAIAARSPSGRGFQFSLNGLFGILVGLEEGIEFNFLGLTTGVDVSPPALKLPGVGRIGFSDFKG